MPMRCSGTVMRLRIRRLAICSVSFFGFLVVLAFVHDSSLFFTYLTMDSDSSLGLPYMTQMKLDSRQQAHALQNMEDLVQGIGGAGNVQEVGDAQGLLDGEDPLQALQVNMDQRNDNDNARQTMDNVNLAQRDANANVGQNGNNANVGQNGNNANVGQNGNNANVGQNGNHANVGQSGNNVNVGQNGNHANVGQNGNNVNVGQNDNNANVGQNGNHANVGQNGNNVNVGQNGNRANVGQNGNHANVGQNGNHANLGQNGNNANVGQNGNNVNVGQKDVNVNLAQENDNANVNQKDNDVNVPQKDANMNMVQKNNYANAVQKVDNANAVQNNANVNIVQKDDTANVKQKNDNANVAQKENKVNVMVQKNDNVNEVHKGNSINVAQKNDNVNAAQNNNNANVAPKDNVAQKIDGAGLNVEQKNAVVNMKQGGNKQSPVSLTSDVNVYDWNKDFKSQYFRGENVPDDMLALDPPSFLPHYKNPCFYIQDPSGGIVLRGDLFVKLKCLPYFHVIGVDKSGTTDLWYRITQHKHVAKNTGVIGKETHWWSWRRFGFDIWVRDRWIRHFDWYISHFDAAARKMTDNAQTLGNGTYHPIVTGEGSPTVFWDFTGWDLMPQNAGRTADSALVTPHCIHHITPHSKLILMLRNPVDRLYSEYLFLDRFRPKHNVSAQLFHEAVVRSITMYQDCVKQHRALHVCLYNKTLHMILPVRIMVGMYSIWLQQWLNVFPKQQILILRNEDYSQHLDTHLAKVFNFLELSPLSEIEMNKIVAQKRVFQRSESEKAVGDMLPATRQILINFYKPFNDELVEMLGDRSFLWQ